MRSIPACAGEPTCAACGSAPVWVYPRVCGGTARAKLSLLPVGGLSPRVRGNHRRQQRLARQKRSIPACAGEPRSGARMISKRRVYPRVCGGTPNVPIAVTRARGLSPRVRGNLFSADFVQQVEGSIPACAGEPPKYRPAQRSERVYPRVCGGTAILSASLGQNRGLSPRVRGNQPRGHPHLYRFGSIPACAGEPEINAGVVEPVRVYPRVCGGTKFSRACTASARGLSPRVRGNLYCAPSWSKSRGSIPACAGEPGCCHRRGQ